MCWILDAMFTRVSPGRVIVFEDDGAKIAYFVQLLHNRALKWAQAALKANPIITYPEFLFKFRNVFGVGTKRHVIEQFI